MPQITRAELEYRKTVIAPRYLAGESARALATELGLKPNTLAQWLWDNGIKRNRPRPPAHYPRWVRHCAFSPCAKALQAIEGGLWMLPRDLTRQIKYSAATIQNAQSALRYIKRHTQKSR